MKIALKEKLFFVMLLWFWVPFYAHAAVGEDSASRVSFLSFFVKGGFMMYPILFCSILIVGIGVERA